MKKQFFPALLSLLLMAQAGEAKVTLPSHFTSNMVVQQQATLKIHGKAAPGKQVAVTASWAKSAILTTASGSGDFSVELQTPKGSTKPQTLTFDDGTKTVLENVLVGEVWLGSGQSNMEMPVVGWGKVLNYEKEVQDANYPMIRLLQVKKTTSIAPKEQVELTMGGWQECSSQTIPEFSALCYFYAVRLWEELKVPIGVIDDDWGGTPCESWVSAQALTGVTGYESLMGKILQLGQDEQRVNAYYKDLSADYNKKEKDTDRGTSAGHAPWYDNSTVDMGWPTMKLPCKWEQAGLSDLDGVVWFRKTVEIPAEWEGKDVTFSLGAIDDADNTYWNGELIGTTSVFTQAAKYTVPGKLVKAGKTQICVRVLDTGGDGGICADAKQMYVEQGGKQISLAGDWKYNLGYNQNELPQKPMAINNSHHPSVLYNAMIHPLIEFPVRGIIWYQGCSNVGRDEQHEVLFQTLINDWRERWQNPNMPFYFVQLANYLQPSDLQPKSGWALLRESQERALCLPNTGMAVNIDLGDPYDIHPKTKRELGRRMAAIALNQTYGKKKVAYSAPVYDGYTVEGSQVRIHLKQLPGCEPLVQEESLKGFIMAGADKQWHVATAKTDGNDIIVTCPQVKFPMAVRYGWADNPTCTLRTKSDLHVAPFRTDAWK